MKLKSHTTFSCLISSISEYGAKLATPYGVSAVCAMIAPPVGSTNNQAKQSAPKILIVLSPHVGRSSLHSQLSEQFGLASPSGAKVDKPAFRAGTKCHSCLTGDAVGTLIAERPP